MAETQVGSPTGHMYVYLLGGFKFQPSFSKYQTVISPTTSRDENYFFLKKPLKPPTLAFIFFRMFIYIPTVSSLTR